ncbi:MULTISPECIES: hypothetical protein [Cedecea]|uniref:Uncharacterized protein n=1 Tax=Cedecea davisae DSM 4568 TaxID=566551 RepID=S3JYV4_9ENTR|nr:MULTISPECIES: hypothetical protein [Cedecea]EPF18214.1 hypothetical protein HMPREF0201_01625 [Cedecea davisae DSM 4568]QIX98253.1 hypothetical protein FOC35_22305 [Cedecea sp. FDAARGOS_727]SUX28123.1 Uncharacterised protein [Cedecea davisae]
MINQQFSLTQKQISDFREKGFLLLVAKHEGERLVDSPLFAGQDYRDLSL